MCIVVVVKHMKHIFLLVKASGQLSIRQHTIFDSVDLKIYTRSTLKSGDECTKYLKVSAYIGSSVLRSVWRTELKEPEITKSSSAIRSAAN